MKYLTLLLILIFSLGLLCFLYLNQGLVTITYFPGDGHQSPPIPVFAVIMLSVIAGVLMAGVIGMGEQLRLRLRLGKVNRKNTALGHQLETMKESAGPTAPSDLPVKAVELPPMGNGETPAP